MTLVSTREVALVILAFIISSSCLLLLISALTHSPFNYFSILSLFTYIQLIQTKQCPWQLNVILTATHAAGEVSATGPAFVQTLIGD